MPDFKTIADFRGDNGPAIRAACAQFVVLCRQLSLFTRAVVAIDGSKFKAVNTRDKNFTVTKVAKRIEQVEASIARYLAALDRADRQDDDVGEAKTVRLKEKIEGLRRQMRSLKEMGKQVEAAPDRQVSLTDPDARSMATSGRGTGVVGYNVQVAVDTEHHLIVAHEVTNIGSDRAQLTSMGQKALDATGCEEITVLADRGYYNGDEVLACEGSGVLPCIPKTRHPATPSAASSPWPTSSTTPRMTATPVRLASTRPEERCVRTARTISITIAISRAVRHRAQSPMHARQTQAPEALASEGVSTRSRTGSTTGVYPKRHDHPPPPTFEHPFGTLKAWMGSTHFLTRTLEKVKTEMSLQVLAYNMKRMVNIFGVKPLMTAIAV